MYIIGGSYSENFIDPQPIPADEMILNFDPDASTFQKVSIKPLGPSDPIPTNLIYHSAFRLDQLNIALIWYDFENQLNPGETLIRRMMKTTIYNIAKFTWKEVNLIS